MGGPSDPHQIRLLPTVTIFMRPQAMGERMAQCVGGEMTRQRPRQDAIGECKLHFINRALYICTYLTSLEAP